MGCGFQTGSARLEWSLTTVLPCRRVTVSMICPSVKTSPPELGRCPNSGVASPRVIGVFGVVRIATVELARWLAMRPPTSVGDAGFAALHRMFLSLMWLLLICLADG